MAPLVSIITATRNRPAVLATALESIAKQTLTDYELIVVDDGSPDGVHEQYGRLLKGFGGRARVLRKDPLHDKSGNPAIARNRGIRAATAKWVAFLDDDDRWLDPSHLEVALRSLEGTGADVFFANLLGERDGVVEIADAYPESSALLRCGACVGSDPPVHRVDLATMLHTLRHRQIHPDVLVTRRELLVSIGAFCERIVFSEDYELMMRVADSATSVLYRPDVVAAYALPTAGSHSLRVCPLDQLLDRQAAAQNARVKCRRAAVRRCARQRESWTLRELAAMMSRNQQRAESLRLQLQACAVCPSPGAIWSLARAVVRAASIDGTGQSEDARTRQVSRSAASS
jgi:GT2 family glycosyltransferase